MFDMKSVDRSIIQPVNTLLQKHTLEEARLASSGVGTFFAWVCIIVNRDWAIVTELYILKYVSCDKKRYPKDNKRPQLEWQIIEEFEDTKGVIRIRNSKKNSKHNGQKKKYKRINNDLQNMHIKLKVE